MGKLRKQRMYDDQAREKKPLKMSQKDGPPSRRYMKLSSPVSTLNVRLLTSGKRRFVAGYSMSSQ